MIDLEALRKKYEELGSQGEGGNTETIFFQIPDKAMVRILPSEDEENKFYAETRIHRIPTGAKSYKNYQCRRVHDEECPLCDVYFQLWEAHNQSVGKGSKEETIFSKKARAIKGRSRYYMNIYDRDTEQVKVLSVGIKLFEKIISNFFDEDYGPKFIDLEEGHDYKIIKKMTEDGRWPRYDDSQPRPKSTPLAESKAKTAAIMDQLHDIQSLVALEKYDDVKRVSDELWAECVSDHTGASDEEESESSGSYLDNIR